MKDTLLFLSCIIIAFGCDTKSEPAEQDAESLRSSLKPTSVKVTTAETKPFEYLIHSTGKVRAAKAVEIKFKASGQLEELTVFNGRSVASGELIARLNDEQQQLTLKKTEADLEQKKFEYESQMMSYSLSEMDKKQTGTIERNIKHASGVVQAELNRQEAALQLSYTQAKTSISGVVANLEVKKGTYINTGDKLCDVYSPKHLEVVTHILEGDLKEILIGQQAIVTPIDNEQAATAVVSEINPQIDKKGMVQVILKITGKTKNLLPGMNTEVLVKVPKEKNIVVPKDAIIIRSGREVVFVAEDKKAKWNYVTTGLDNGKEVEILEGLEEHDQIIVTNNLQLAHDALIEIEK